MVETSIPWRRDGNNSWNDLVQRVNEILENPPENTDCEPIDPLPEVDECHQWTTQDITDMQDALKEACDTNEFTEVIPCDKWKKSIIEEIETAIDTGFCDCETLEECIPPCDNQGEEVETFLQSDTITECGDFTLSFLCPEEAFNSIQLFDEYNGFRIEYTLKHAASCELIKEVEELQEELDDLNDELDELNEELDVLIDAKEAACSAEPGGAACIALTAAVVAKETEISEKETEIEEKEEELEEKTDERDTTLAEAAAAKTSMVDKAAETVTNAQNAVTNGPPLIDLVLTDPEPWTNWECDDPLKLPICSARVIPGGLLLDPCEVGWILQVRVFEIIGRAPHPDCSPTGPQPGFPRDWLTVLSGEYTVDGTIVVANFNGCRQRQVIACISNDCSGALGGCGGCSLTSITFEYQQITRFPAVREPVTCDTEEPCIPGENPEEEE